VSALGVHLVHRSFQQCGQSPGRAPQLRQTCLQCCLGGSLHRTSKRNGLGGLPCPVGNSHSYGEYSFLLLAVSRWVCCRGSLTPRLYYRRPSLGRREDKRCRRAALIVERVEERFQVPDGFRDHTQDVIVLARHPMILKDIRIGDSLRCYPIRLQLAGTFNVNESFNRVSSSKGIDTGTVASYHPVPLKTSHSASDRRGGQPYVSPELSVTEAGIFLEQPQQFPIHIIQSRHVVNFSLSAFQRNIFRFENFTSCLPPMSAFSVGWMPCWNNLTWQPGRWSVKASA
jgi:hypothetical protein